MGVTSQVNFLVQSFSVHLLKGGRVEMEGGRRSGNNEAWLVIGCASSPPCEWKNINKRKKERERKGKGLERWLESN